MSPFSLESWDKNQLVVNRSFADLFRQRGWTTFESIWQSTADAAVAKNLRTDRVTLRFTINDGVRDHLFFIKRHGQSSWKEYIKPLLRLTWPILGARNEWNAILEFHQAGLPTMTPVAFGQSGRNSFLITEALEGCTKLSELPELFDPVRAGDTRWRNQMIQQIAVLARKMHSSGFHHQDFYLGHLMQSHANPEKLFIIDLGRVKHHSALSRRWIVKDLAQLNFSAPITPTERLRFLRDYYGRKLTRRDRRLMRQIPWKTALISRHSRKNSL